MGPRGGGAHVGAKTHTSVGVQYRRAAAPFATMGPQRYAQSLSSLMSNKTGYCTCQGRRKRSFESPNVFFFQRVCWLLHKMKGEAEREIEDNHNSKSAYIRRPCSTKSRGVNQSHLNAIHPHHLCNNLASYHRAKYITQIETQTRLN